MNKSDVMKIMKWNDVLGIHKYKARFSSSPDKDLIKAKGLNDKFFK